MSAAEAYATRLEQARTAGRRRALWAARVSNLRLLVFALGLGVAWSVFGAGRLPAWCLAPPVLLFAALVVTHDLLLRARAEAQRRAEFYERGLARLEDRWAGEGRAGEDFADPSHPYALDLDLFGRGSLFELLCSARTQQGERVLADWLCAPAGAEVVRSRQQAVEELRPGLDLREDLATLGEEVRATLHAEAVRRWGEAEPGLPRGWLRGLAAALPVATLATGVACLDGLPAGWLLPPLGLQMVFALALRPRVRRVLAAVDLPGRELELVGRLLARVERERFRTPLLRALRERLDTEGVPASRRIAALRRRIDLLDARRNQFFAPIAALLLWTTQSAFALEHWRATCGPSLGSWIDVMGELEALLSLAGFAFERPEYPFPELRAEGSWLRGEGLGHPLLPADRCVPNDVSLGGELRVLVVSGSNMSGKSTLLRTLGTNAVLAFAGAPVRARSLELSPLSIGASIRSMDSLQEGSSRFYAEILRLRQIVEIAEAGPTLFLLDEILHGTNSHDRGIGGEAVVRGLVGLDAIGVVTTHDLALARIAESLAPRGRNVHFEDHLEEGRMSFDYRLREGVVRKSNALELMRAVGLSV